LTVIAIDGPSGSGKSSLAREIAWRLGLEYLDTGAMYRALTWSMTCDRVDLTDEAAMARYARGAELEFRTGLDDRFMAVQGRPVPESAIRSVEVTANVSAVSSVPAVRARLRRAQRAIIVLARMRSGGIVVEGRDITTVVAPEAEVKVLITASEAARAVRRAVERGLPVDEVRAAIAGRDTADAAVSNFMSAADGVSVLNTSELNLEQVVEAVLDLIMFRTGLRPQTV
jgi:cytidylate kinase